MELLKETHIVFGEHSEVLHLVFEVGDTLYAHTEGIACVDAAVNAVGLKHVGVHHSATEDFHPACLLAEGTTLAAADIAGDVHLGAGFGEGEVGGTQTNLGVGTKHLAGKGEEHLLEVGKGDVLVNVQAFDLMEEAVCAGRDGLVAVNTTGTNHTDRRLHSLHHAALHGRGVGAQEHIGLTGHEEGVLHVASRMVVGKVHRTENVPIVLHLGTIGKREAEAREDVNNLVAHEGQGVARTQSDGIRRAGQVEVIVVVFAGSHCFFEGSELFLKRRLEFVELHAHFAFLLSRHIAKVGHQVVDDTFLAEIFDAQGIPFLRSSGSETINFA